MSINDLYAYDFHSHTLLSDGDENLDALCRAAADSGIRFLGITDHDAVHPRAVLRAMEEKHGITLVSGSEVSCYWPARDGRQAIVHLGGHWLREGEPDLEQVLAHNQAQDFDGRVLAMLRACEKLGLRPYGESPEANLARIRAAHPHSVHFGKRAVARLMAESGCVPDSAAAYELMARGGPAYVPVTDHMRFVGFWDAVEAITKSGLCTLNHLHYSGLDPVDEEQLRRDFKDAGGDALEAHYHRYTPQQRRELVMKAEALELMTNAGSDRHDPSRPFMRGYGLNYLALSIRQRQKHGSLWR